MRAYDAVTHSDKVMNNDTFDKNIQITRKYNVHTDYFDLGRINWDKKKHHTFIAHKE